MKKSALLMMIGVALISTLVPFLVRAQSGTYYRDMTGLLNLPYDGTQFDLVTKEEATGAKATFVPKGTKSENILLMVLSELWPGVRSNDEDTEHALAATTKVLAGYGFVFANDLNSAGTCKVQHFTKNAGTIDLILIVGTNNQGFCNVYYFSERGDSENMAKTFGLFVEAFNAMKRESLAEQATTK